MTLCKLLHDSVSQLPHLSNEAVVNNVIGINNSQFGEMKRHINFESECHAEIVYACV